MISNLLRKRRFIIHKNERAFLIRGINDLERRQVEAELNLKTNKEKNHSLEQHSVFLQSENKYWEKELDKIELALEEQHEKLRELTRTYHEFIDTM